MTSPRGDGVVIVNMHAVIDEFYSVPNFEVDGTFRCEAVRCFPAGKGVNAAYALAGLGRHPSLVLAVGKKEVPLYEASLEARGIDLHAIPVQLPTRRHITIGDPARQTTTHLQAAGAMYPREIASQALEVVERLAQPGNIVILSGSLPPGVPADFYGHLIETVHARGADSFLDTSGEALRLGAAANPTAIKPNREEAEFLLGAPLPDSEKQLEAARRLHAGGIERVLLSDGANGIILVCGRGAWHGIIPAEEIHAVNTQGCGDSAAAGCVDAWRRGCEPPEILRWAVACGAANALADGAGWIRIEDVERLHGKVRIITL